MTDRGVGPDSATDWAGSGNATGLAGPDNATDWAGAGRVVGRAGAGRVVGQGGQGRVDLGGRARTAAQSRAAGIALVDQVKRGRLLMRRSQD